MYHIQILVHHIELVPNISFILRKFRFNNTAIRKTVSYRYHFNYIILAAQLATPMQNTVKDLHAEDNQNYTSPQQNNHQDQQ